MATLSQVIFGVRDLDGATDRFRDLGFDVLDGGVHPGVGTANRVIPVGDAYLELLGVVSLEAARANDYGRSLLQAIGGGDRIVRWSLRTDAIDVVAARLGLTVEARRRVRPDGELLTWRAAGLDRALAESSLPFFMQWDRPEQYPGSMPAQHANGARRVTRLTISPHDDARFRAWTSGAGAPVEVVSGEPGIVSVSLQTDDGELTIRA